jgi:hypothetical protein
MSTKYIVYTSLGGNSATRRCRKAYKSLAAARVQARLLTGYGIVGIVVDRETGKVV